MISAAIKTIVEKNQHADKSHQIPEGENQPSVKAPSATYYPQLRPKLRNQAGPHSTIQFLRRQAGSQNMRPLLLFGTADFPSCCEHEGNCACCEHEAETGDHVAAHTVVGVSILWPRTIGPPGESRTNNQYDPARGSWHITQGEQTDPKSRKRDHHDSQACIKGRQNMHRQKYRGVQKGLRKGSHESQACTKGRPTMHRQKYRGSQKRLVKKATNMCEQHYRSGTQSTSQH